jgi:hypothetical protein
MASATTTTTTTTSATPATAIVHEDPLSNIRRTTAAIMAGVTEHVTIDDERLAAELKDHPELYREKALPSWLVT